jgi:hypothetical protein
MDNVGDIFIVDNGSDYPPLLEWYNEAPCEIIKTSNIGHTAPWESGLVSKLGIPYIVTDSDLGIDDLPNDTLKVLLEKLNENKSLGKVGLGLIWENVTPESPYYTHLNTYEKQRWERSRIINDVYVDVHIDTTFALYSEPNYFIGGGSLPSPYKARHYPWEFTNEQRNANVEFDNYIKTASSSSSYKVYLEL